MAARSRPSISGRTSSTPLGLSLSVPGLSNKKKHSAPYQFNILTPPASPARSRHSRSSIDLSINAIDTELDQDELYTESGVLICPFEVQTLKDNQDRKQVFGYGAWSTVYKAIPCVTRMQSSGLATPPMSHHKSPPVFVAVKTPARNDAKTILESEAKVLTHLQGEIAHEHYVVQFYGINVADSSLVLGALPISLEDHIRQCAVSAKATRTTWNMTLPVIGTDGVWLSLASHLISALAWMHNDAMVIHGDIKPGNILLAPLTTSDTNSAIFPYQAVFTDFSSSQFIATTEPTHNTLSAITREYTAPELLSAKVLLDPNSTATTASDVFSLAVTLLVAATGNTMVYPGSGFQRQAMATQGWDILNMIRSTDDGVRLPRQGIIERVLDRAVLKYDMGRIDALQWERVVKCMAHGEPSKMNVQL